MKELPTVAANIRNTRKNKKISQVELAKKSGVSQQAISNIETGCHSPTQITLRLLAQAMDVSVAYLLGETDKEKSPSVQTDGHEKLMDEVMEAFAALPDDLKRQALAYVAGRLASRKDQ